MFLFGYILLRILHVAASPSHKQILLLWKWQNKDVLWLLGRGEVHKMTFSMTGPLWLWPYAMEWAEYTKQKATIHLDEHLKHHFCVLMAHANNPVKSAHDKRETWQHWHASFEPQNTVCILFSFYNLLCLLLEEDLYFTSLPLFDSSYVHWMTSTPFTCRLV